MKCADAEGFIALDVEGDLAEVRVAALRDHLATCARCEEFAQGMRESQQLLRALRREGSRESLLSGARQAALEDLRLRQQNGGWEWTPHPRLRWVYGAGGLAVVAWATIGWMALQRSGTPVPVADATVVQKQETAAKIVVPSARQAPAKSSHPGTVTKIRARDESPADVSPATGNVVTLPLAAQQRVVVQQAGQGEASDSPVAPRIEIFSTGPADDSPDPDSDTTVLKIASSDPNVLLYWVMDSQGGS